MTTPKKAGSLRRLLDRLAELLRGGSSSRVKDLFRASKAEEKQRKDSN